MKAVQPSSRPGSPCFSSGPTRKRPGWALGGLDTRSLGRSHRAAYPKSRLAAVIEQSRELLGLPEDWLLGIVPGSDTGAFEMGMWNLLGARGVNVLAWESFGLGWANDIKAQLRLDDVREHLAGYGQLPDLAAVDTGTRDTVFAWNGTTSGVKVPNGDWIAEGREGLVLCDATSAVFAMPIDWQRLDLATWSWQKALGGEAGHGMLALSPRAVARLTAWQPPWPLPKVFRLAKQGALTRGIFEGATINTPSLLAVEDQLDALAWARQAGGLAGLIERSRANLAVVSDWVAKSDWADFLAEDPECRSSTSICLKVVDGRFTRLDEDAQRRLIKRLTGLLEEAGVGYDLGGHRDAPPGLRIWGGGTVEAEDIRLLLPWLDWAWRQAR